MRLYKIYKNREGGPWKDPIGFMYGIFTYIYHIDLCLKVDKYISPMDPMGMMLLGCKQC